MLPLDNVILSKMLPVDAFVIVGKPLDGRVVNSSKFASELSLLEALNSSISQMKSMG